MKYVTETRDPTNLRAATKRVGVLDTVTEAVAL